MKATVHVCRIGYAHRDIGVEVDDSVVKGMTLKQRQQLFLDLALDKAGDCEFSETDSKYEAQGVTIQ